MVGGLLGFFIFQYSFLDYLNRIPGYLINISYYSYLTGCLKEKQQPILPVDKNRCLIKAQSYSDSLKKGLYGP